MDGLLTPSLNCRLLSIALSVLRPDSKTLPFVALAHPSEFGMEALPQLCFMQTNQRTFSDLQEVPEDAAYCAAAT